MILNLIFIIAIGFLIFTYNKKQGDPAYYANLSTSIGVLGTFLGIVLGLMNFDVNNISTSVPMLLEGMKTAFITSIAGMIGAIIIKAIHNKSENKEENIDDIVELFNKMITENRAINKTLLENQNQTSVIFNNMSKKWSENQQELIEEVHSLNVSLSSKQEELINEFREFGKEMAKNNSEALIEALNDVIKDFNNKISEQFGENFKQLNQAVGGLLVWQENYKETVDKTFTLLTDTFDSIHFVEKSFKEIEKSSKTLIDTSATINDVLVKVNESHNKLSYGMENLVKISDNALESIPKINSYFEASQESVINMSNKVEKVLVETNEKFGQQVESYLVEFSKVIETLNNCIPDVNEHLKATNERFNSTLSAFTSEIGNTLALVTSEIETQSEFMKTTNTRVYNQLDTVITESTKRIEDVTANTSGEISKIVEEMEKVFIEKVEQLDNLLETELTKSLTTLGRQLVTISERFTGDYGRLADKMKDVMEVAERVS